MTKYEEVITKYRPTIGIECHVQLKTNTKLFSGADNDARDKAPNTTVSPVCFGLPGVLPVLNQDALTLAIRAGLAMNSEIPELSRFERKHYFYPDLPKGYQITQLAEPIIVGGSVRAVLVDGNEVIVKIHHAHLEEDAGKLTHPDGASESLVDLNRAGTPLIEIVSEPDMHSPAEARAYVQELYRLMTYAGVTYGDLYHGNMRFDVNISLAAHGSQELGIRAEIKNLNSFRAVEKAAEYECLRQAELLDSGQQVVQETRGWNEDRQKTFSQRTKENAHDYRYFPDADIPPVKLTKQDIEQVAESMPMLPDDYRSRWAALGFDVAMETTLLSSPETAKTITTILEKGTKEDARRVAHWYTSGVVAETSDGIATTDDPETMTISNLIELSQMVSSNKLSSTAAKRVFNEMRHNGQSPEQIAQSLNLIQVSDEAELTKIVDEVLSEPASQKAIEDIRSGNDKAIGYLVGQVMKRSGGKANPSMASNLIRAKL